MIVMTMVTNSMVLIRPDVRYKMESMKSEHIQMMAWLEQERLEGERERGEGDTYVVYQVGLARQSKIY